MTSLNKQKNMVSDERIAALLAADQQTQAIRAGHVSGPEGEHSAAIYATSSFVFETAQDAAARFAGDQVGNVYSRYTNPTVRAFEERIALLEGAEKAVATASGMAAITSVFLALLKAGDHIVCSRSIFGATTAVLDRYLSKYGIQATFVEATNYKEWQAAANSNTRLFFLETPSNPLADIVDIAKVADIAHKNNALLVVDNCFCTPAVQQPIKFGADIVVHSATKYIDGQGRALGGVVCGAKEQLGDILRFVRATGPSMSPFNAWIFLKGLETLQLRMQAHCASALALAQWLDKQEAVEKVFYAGLEDHPGHDLASKQQKGFGGVLSFRIKGDKEAAWRFIDATRVISITANLGDAKSTIIHPATTTHASLSVEQRQQSGISDNLIRVSVGLESLEDLKIDLQRGIAAL